MGEGSEGNVPEDVEREILRYALKNAVDHGGRARPGPVINKILGTHPEYRGRERLRELGKKVAEVVRKVNSMSLEEQQHLLKTLWPELETGRSVAKEGKSELPPLPNAVKGGIVTRFAPNPDFLIHLGNARPAYLSFKYAEMYEGRMILRFEDTDPKTKTPMPEAYRLIREDLKWLGIRWDEEYIQSLRMDIYYRMAKELIESGGAYVDLCSQKEFLKYKLTRRPCPHRTQSVEENLELFDRMVTGAFSEGEAVLRVKTDVSHKDPSVIDWVAFRIIDTDRHPHPIVGSKYVAWPTYNFAAAVDDHLLGVTHILRGKEHAVNTVKQGYLYAHLGWKYPTVVNLGRLKLEGLILSKSVIKKLLEEKPGVFSGPDDVRFGTIAALRNRGVEAEALRRVILKVGINPNDATISWDNIAALNRRLIDPETPRLMAVFNPVKLIIRGYAGPKNVLLPYHPDNEELGSREVPVTIRDGNAVVLIQRQDLRGIIDSSKREFRLMGLCNVRLCEGISGNEDEVTCEYVGRDLSYARGRDLRILQWVPASNHVRIEVLIPQGLELKVDKGVAEPSVTTLASESGRKLVRCQLIRYGFVKLLKPELGGVKAVFIHK